MREAADTRPTDPVGLQVQEYQAMDLCSRNCAMGELTQHPNVYTSHRTRAVQVSWRNPGKPPSHLSLPEYPAVRLLQEDTGMAPVPMVGFFLPFSLPFSLTKECISPSLPTESKPPNLRQVPVPQGSLSPEYKQGSAPTVSLIVETATGWMTYTTWTH